MTKLPAKNNDQSAYIKTALRLPRDLHAEVLSAAERNGRSMNAEILSRIRADHSADILDQLADLKKMVARLIDQA